MHIPPYHREPSWQRFFAGAIVGAILSWGIFVFLFGAIQDRQVNQIVQYKKQVEKLEERLHILTEDNEKLKEDKEKLKVQDIYITINNHDKYKLNSLDRVHIIESIQKDLNHLITRDIKSINDNKDFIVKAIESTPYKIDNKSYYFRVFRLYIDTTIEIELTVVKMDQAT